MNRLLITLKPFKDESLHGYITRLAIENGASPLNLYILADLNVNKEKSNLHLITKETQSYNFTKLSMILNKCQSELLDMSFYNELGKFLDYDSHQINVIHRWGIFARRTNICPKCLKEQSYLRKNWDVHLYTCCPKHGCLLLERCPTCNRYIRNFGHKVSLIECMCGFKFTDAVTKNVEIEETNFAELIDELSTSTSNLTHSLNPLYDLELRHLLYIMIFFTKTIARYE